MKRMNKKAGKLSANHNIALSGHRHFKGDCNDAARKGAKKQISDEISLLDKG
jgi:hypothetical protein